MTPEQTFELLKITRELVTEIGKLYAEIKELHMQIAFQNDRIKQLEDFTGQMITPLDNK